MRQTTLNWRWEDVRARPFKPFRQGKLNTQTDAAFRALATHAPDVAPKQRRVLLLQGPVGPFFARLRSFLCDKDVDTWRVVFHRGDRLFGSGKRTLPFSGGHADWSDWLSQVLTFGQFDTIILFGSERPAHCAARKLATQKGIAIISLEEGYVRPGFITVETDGNNANSPIAGRVLGPIFGPENNPTPAKSYRSLHQLIFYGALYYTVRGITVFGKRRQLFHRQTPLIPEAYYWARNLCRRITGGERNFAKVQQLLEHWDKRFYLVPLQVAADANLTRFANGWHSARLISDSIQSFAACAPRNTRLVFKVHPMERGHNNLTPLIRQTALAYGIESHVDVIETGSLGLLTRHSAGMITINSTSGLSAIFHGVPLMVLGRAIYAHKELAITTPAFDDFWTSDHVATAEARGAYIEWIKQQALRPGNFYCAEGMELAMQSIFEKLCAPQQVASDVIPMRAVS